MCLSVEDIREAIKLLKKDRISSFVIRTKGDLKYIRKHDPLKRNWKLGDEYYVWIYNDGWYFQRGRIK